MSLNALLQETNVRKSLAPRFSLVRPPAVQQRRCREIDIFPNAIVSSTWPLRLQDQQAFGLAAISIRLKQNKHYVQRPPFIVLKL